MSDHAAGALAYAQGVSYEMNPHVPGGPEVAEKCRVNEWPVAAREWHRGWREAAIARAEAAEAVREWRGRMIERQTQNDIADRLGRAKAEAKASEVSA